MLLFLRLPVLNNLMSCNNLNRETDFIGLIHKSIYSSLFIFPSNGGKKTYKGNQDDVSKERHATIHVVRYWITYRSASWRLYFDTVAMAVRMVPVTIPRVSRKSLGLCQSQSSHCAEALRGFNKLIDCIRAPL